MDCECVVQSFALLSGYVTALSAKYKSSTEGATQYDGANLRKRSCCLSPFGLSAKNLLSLLGWLAMTRMRGRSAIRTGTQSYQEMTSLRSK